MTYKVSEQKYQSTWFYSVVMTMTNVQLRVYSTDYNSVAFKQSTNDKHEG